MVRVRYWPLNRFALMVVKMLLNKFDCFIIIEGNRGLGKSTLAYHLNKRIAHYFKLIVKETGGENSPYKDWYKFNPLHQLKKSKKEKYLLYTQQDVIDFFDKWHTSGVADEMINVAFNREFWSNDQKNLIKMMNMNRDHCNLLTACVPQFQTLDNQIKNLCKIRLTVVRRGLAVIQTPNRTIYNKDKWDTANNERIEREWLKKGSGLPQYSKLNTFRGLMKFKPLSEKEQTIYDKIKVRERNIIKGELGVSQDKKESEDPMDKLYQRLTAGDVRNSSELQGISFALNMTLGQVQAKLTKMLKKDGKNYSVSSYYWDKKGKKEGVLGIS